MKIFQVHNWHRFGSGSESVVNANTDLLRRRGHQVILIMRDSRDLGRGIFGKVRAGICGIYSVSGRKIMANLIRDHKPDIVHVHELYPFFSPWILVDCHKAHVPVVMTCHDYRLTCPMATHYRNNRICEKCTGGKEYHCIINNCRGNVWESIAFALRSTVSRKSRLFYKNITMFIALTAFAKDRLIAAGFNEDRIAILPNMLTGYIFQKFTTVGNYVAFVGRISEEKGIDTLLAAGSLLSSMPIRIAGDGPLRIHMAKKAPNNATFVGMLTGEELSVFYQQANSLVVPSKCFEGFPIVILEAMSHSLPVIAAKIGGLPDIIEDGVTGLLFEPGNVEDLASKIKLLWENPGLCREMGQAGLNKLMCEYNEDIHYERLINVYKKAIDVNKTIN